MSLQRCKKLSDTSITMLSLVRSFWLRTTGVSITPTKHTPWCLGYHQSLSLWFHKWLWTLPSSFLPRCGVNADLTLRLVPICKFSSMVGTILTLELRKWSCLCSCHLDQRCGSMTILCFLGPLFLRNLGTRFLLWGRAITPHVTGILIKLFKLQLSHKARENQVIEVWKQNSKSWFKFKVFKSCLVWTDLLSQ
jgi:hypothetical protein